MNEIDAAAYRSIASGTPGFAFVGRGLVRVWGGEAVKFLNGLITNDVAALVDGNVMRAAFPNAQGRLIAVVGVRRAGDEFLFDCDESTHVKVVELLTRFTFAGDFKVEDMPTAAFVTTEPTMEFGSGIAFDGDVGRVIHIPVEEADSVRAMLVEAGAVDMSPELYEVVRVERGVPRFGVDIDETTIVPEIGTDGLISYNKGCYIGQEIIARIHFRGHVAKQLRRLRLDGEVEAGADLTAAADGKPAGRVDECRNDAGRRGRRNRTRPLRLPGRRHGTDQRRAFGGRQGLKNANRRATDLTSAVTQRTGPYSAEAPEK